MTSIGAMPHPGATKAETRGRGAGVAARVRPSIDRTHSPALDRDRHRKAAERLPYRDPLADQILVERLQDQPGDVPHLLVLKPEAQIGYRFDNGAHSIGVTLVAANGTIFRGNASGLDPSSALLRAGVTLRGQRLTGFVRYYADLAGDRTSQRVAAGLQLASLAESFAQWSTSRSVFQEHVRQNRPAAPADRWQKLYCRGLMPGGERGVADHQTRAQSCPFAAAEF